jgi:hypothetical protein
MKIDENILRLCYLFFSLDKTISKDNLSIFKEICHNSGLPEFNEEAIISECEQIIAMNSPDYDRFAVISEAIKVITEPNESNALSFSPLSNRSGQRECLWLLECLAWQDGESSENEKKIIHRLASQWKIDGDVLLEIEDTAQTLYEIDNYRSFLKTTHESAETLKILFQELDKNQSKLIDNIFETLNI